MNSNTSEYDSLKLLSFNVGLLRLSLFGIPVFSNPPYANQRLPYIPNKIRCINADIVSIQECYEKKHADFIISNLRDIYPYNARYNTGGIIKFHNGLLFLSKYPISRSYIEKLEKVATLEAWMATKQNLVMTVDIPCIGMVSLVNMHATAGGVTHPENPGVDTDREDELRQAIECLSPKRVCICMYVCVYMYRYVYIVMLYMYICIVIYVCMYTCIYVLCIYVYVCM